MQSYQDQGKIGEIVHLALHYFASLTANKGLDDIPQPLRGGLALELVSNCEDASEAAFEAQHTVLPGLHPKGYRFFAQPGRIGFAQKLVSGRNRAAKINRQVYKRRSDVAIEFKLIPPFAIEMRLPPGIDRVEREPRKARGIGDARGVTIPPSDIHGMNERLNAHQ